MSDAYSLSVGDEDYVPPTDEHAPIVASRSDDFDDPDSPESLARQAMQSSPVRERYTDVGNARVLVGLFGSRVRYVGAWGSWLVWDGRRWRRDTKGEVYELAKQVAVQLWTDADRVEREERKKAVRHALLSESANRITAMVKLSATDPLIAVDPDELDADPWLLNVLNGTLDLRSGRLSAHEPRDLITKLAGVAYEPDAAAPIWSAFLERVLPDEDVRTFNQRWFGYSLTGSVSEQKVRFDIGAGANGKSTLVAAVATVMGDYARQAAPDLLMRRRDDPHPTGLADLHGARLVLATETAQGRSLDDALVKRLTGGDRVKARHMHKDFFEFQPSHKFIVATNHRPTITGTDHAIWRRIRLVPYTVTIPDEEQDRHLDGKLAAEGPGILLWALRGCLAWQSEGLTEPYAITSATADYRAEMDVLAGFISDCCLLDASRSTKSSDLYAKYQAWAAQTGEEAINQRALGLALKDKGLESYRSDGKRWRGIGLLSEPTFRTTDRETAGQSTLTGESE